jgi:hypothetical protein
MLTMMNGVNRNALLALFEPEDDNISGGQPGGSSQPRFAIACADPLLTNALSFTDRTGQRLAGMPDACRRIVINRAVQLGVELSRRFSDLAVFDSCLYIPVRHVDEPA